MSDIFTAYRRQATQTLGTEAPSVYRWLTLVALCLAVLAAQVDTSVVNLASSAIGRYFAVGVAPLQWVLDSYNLVYAVLLLSGGLLADFYGRRRLFMIGAGIFTAASMLCALAPTISILIVGRALAGLGAAFLIPASLALIRVVWCEPVERGRVLGIWAACNGLALAIGPTLGGLLLAQFGWRSIFLAVMPFGLCALALAFLFIPESSDRQVRLLGASVSALLAILRIRRYQAAFIATTGMTFGMYGVIFLLPLTWQDAGRLGPIATGVALVPMALLFVMISPFSGKLSEKFESRVVISAGLAIIATGLLIIGVYARAASIVPAEFGLMLTGIGMGLATGPLMAAAVGAVAAARSGLAAALINVARMAGATMGVAILGLVFSMAQEDYDGLRAAMVASCLVQAVCIVVAWQKARI